MGRQIYVNLPVRDLKRSVDFFTGLGFAFNPQFTDENGTCMIVADDIFVMLLTEKFFKTFTTKAIADTSKATEVLTCLSCDSREELEAMVKKAAATGGKIPRPAQDHGFMYQHAFEDPDGHTWELVHLTGAPPA